MKKLALTLTLLALAVFSTAAMATSVTYNTLACFGGPPCTATLVSAGSSTPPGAIITFTGVPLTPVSTPTFNSLGSFSLSGAGGTFFAVPFTLTIFQTVPSTTSGTLSATVSGTLTSTSSGVVVTFSTSSILLDTITYTLTNSTLPVAFNAATPVIAHITSPSDPIVPEPASLALLGTGLLFGGGFVRRKLIAR